MHMTQTPVLAHDNHSGITGCILLLGYARREINLGISSFLKACSGERRKENKKKKKQLKNLLPASLRELDLWTFFFSPSTFPFQIPNHRIWRRKANLTGEPKWVFLYELFTLAKATSILVLCFHWGSKSAPAGTGLRFTDTVQVI